MYYFITYRKFYLLVGISGSDDEIFLRGPILFFNLLHLFRWIYMLHRVLVPEERHLVQNKQISDFSHFQWIVPNFLNFMSPCVLIHRMPQCSNLNGRRNEVYWSFYVRFSKNYLFLRYWNFFLICGISRSVWWNFSKCLWPKKIFSKFFNYFGENAFTQVISTRWTSFGTKQANVRFFNKKLPIDT